MKSACVGSLIKYWYNNVQVYMILQDGNDQGGNELQAVGNWQGKLPDNHDAVRPREADKVHLLP